MKKFIETKMDMMARLVLAAGISCVGPEGDSTATDTSQTGGPTITSTVRSGVAPRI